MVFGLRLSEYHTGFRAYSRELLETIPYRLNSDDFVFDQELVARAVTAGFRIGHHDHVDAHRADVVVRAEGRLHADHHGEERHPYAYSHDRVERDEVGEICLSVRAGLAASGSGGFLGALRIVAEAVGPVALRFSSAIGHDERARPAGYHRATSGRSSRLVVSAPAHHLAVVLDLGGPGSREALWCYGVAVILELTNRRWALVEERFRSAAYRTLRQFDNHSSLH